MKELVFSVQGSAKEPYKVTFQKNGDNLSAYCTCPAGNNGQFCKHRFNILGNFTVGIVSGNEHEVDTIASWLSGTDVEDALTELINSEEQFEIAKSKLASAKKRLANLFRQ